MGCLPPLWKVSSLVNRYFPAEKILAPVKRKAGA